MKLLTFGVFFILYHAVTLAQFSPDATLRDKPPLDKTGTLRAKDEKSSWLRVSPNDPYAQPVSPPDPEFCRKYPELCMPAQEDFIANDPRTKPVSPSDVKFCIKHPEKCRPNPKTRTARDGEPRTGSGEMKTR